LEIMDRVEEMIEVQFATFQSVLRSNLAGLEVAQQLCQLKRLKADNQRLDETVDRLAADVRRWLVVKNQLLKVASSVSTAADVAAASGVGSDRNNNTTTQEGKPLDVAAAANFIDDDNNTKEILDAFADDIGLQLKDLKEPERLKPEVTTACNAPPVSKSSSITFKTGKKRGLKAAAAAAGKFKREAVLTRSRRGVKGGVLVNPIKYHDCLLCTAGFYTDKALRHHYKKWHGLDFGDAGLPTDQLQLKCQQVDRQESPKCNICGDDFKSLEEALVHKTNRHVEHKFRRHACPSCPMRFVLAKELQDHLMIHSAF